MVGIYPRDEMAVLCISKYFSSMAKLLDKLYLVWHRPMTKQRILLVDDHRILLQGTESLINTSTNYEVTDTADSPERAQQLIKANEYDVLITDYEMPGMTGLELIQMARAVMPEIKSIVLSMHDDPAVVRTVLRQGVDGYVLKKDAYQSIKMALDKVLQGRKYVSEDISDLLIRGLEEPANTVLSPRETEILQLIVQEYSTKQIAEILFISERTVETHRKNILKKSGANGLVGLIKFAYSQGLV